MTAIRTSRLTALFEVLGAVCLVALMVTVTVDVLGRNLINKPLPWGTEVLEILLAAMIFLLYPVLALGSGHITVDLITVPPQLHRVQRVLGDVMGTALFALIAFCLLRQTVRAAGYGENTALLGVPIAWLLGGMALFAAFTALAFGYAGLRALRDPLPVRPVPKEMN